MAARVIVVGTGAVGGYFGACLARSGHDVTFVARGANLAALKKDGLRITGAMGDFTLDEVAATDDPSSIQAADLVLLCVKNYDLADAATTWSKHGEVFVTLQNGVEAGDVVRAIVGDAVLAGTTGIVADLGEPGHINVISNYAWIRFGEASGGGITPRVEGVRDILAVNGVEPFVVEDARVALWEKMSLMCGMAGLTTLHQRPMGEILSDPELRASFEAIVCECETVARALEVPLPDEFSDTSVFTFASRIDPTAMSSMSRDFARGKQIELETFNGAIVRMGAELGIDVPANRAVYDGIKAALTR